MFPLPPLVEPTVTELTFNPIELPVTVRLKVQLPPGTSEPTLRETVSWAGLLSVKVSVPPHWLEDPATRSNPAGRVSVKLIPVNVVVRFGFSIVKLRSVVALVRIELASKVLAIDGGATTVSGAMP